MSTKFERLCVEAELLRQAKVAARSERGSHKYLCEHERLHPELKPPCWKRRTHALWAWQDKHGIDPNAHYDDPGHRPIPREEWCDNCRDRQRHHDEYMRLTRKLGAVRAALTKMAKRTGADELMEMAQNESQEAA